MSCFLQMLFFQQMNEWMDCYRRTKRTQKIHKVFSLKIIYPLDFVDQRVYNLVYHHRITDLSFCKFLLYNRFNMNKFAVLLTFWLELNRLKKDEWFSLTDEIIDLIGYKCSASNNTHNRSNLMWFIRKNFEEGTDFAIAQVAKTSTAGRSKMKIQMRKYPFKKMLMKVGTTMSDTIHDYLISLEDATMKYMSTKFYVKELPQIEQTRFLKKLKKSWTSTHMNRSMIV